MPHRAERFHGVKPQAATRAVLDDARSIAPWVVRRKRPSAPTRQAVVGEIEPGRSWNERAAPL